VYGGEGVCVWGGERTVPPATVVCGLMLMCGLSFTPLTYDRPSQLRDIFAAVWDAPHEPTRPRGWRRRVHKRE
jgi:hypothetical protein